LVEKHLQAYLDEFCFRFNRRRAEGQLFNRLLNACAQLSPTSRRLVLMLFARAIIADSILSTSLDFNASEALPARIVHLF